MRHALLSSVVLAASAFAVGCSDTQLPTQATADPLFAKPVAGSTNSNGNWVWHTIMSDGSATRIFGDGKAKNGVDPAPLGTSEYEGKLCGVDAYIQQKDNSGDARLDVDYAESTCPRKILVDLDAVASTPATPAGVLAHAYRINRVENKTDPRFMMLLDVPIDNCTQLRYGVLDTSKKTLDEQIISADKSTGVIVTRMNAEGEPGKWTIETVNGGKAQCYNSYKGGWGPTGPEVYLPFRITVTEIR